MHWEKFQKFNQNPTKNIAFWKTNSGKLLWHAWGKGGGDLIKLTSVKKTIKKYPCSIFRKSSLLIFIQINFVATLKKMSRNYLETFVHLTKAENIYKNYVIRRSEQHWLVRTHDASKHIKTSRWLIHLSNVILEWWVHSLSIIKAYKKSH